MHPLGTAYHLLAARNDKIVDDVLSRVVVLIDPTQNPDGRDRFVNYFEQTRGLVPDATYWWGTEQQFAQPEGGVAWTGQSMVFPMKWP